MLWGSLLEWMIWSGSTSTMQISICRTFPHQWPVLWDCRQGLSLFVFHVIWSVSPQFGLTCTWVQVHAGCSTRHLNPILNKMDSQCRFYNTRGYMVRFVCVCDYPGGIGLYTLEPWELTVWQAVQQCIVIVQTNYSNTTLSKKTYKTTMKIMYVIK